MDSFEQLCRHRRSIRRYKDQTIERDKLDTILRCGLMSPSGKRINPWHFFVLTDTDKIRQLSACRTYGSQMFDTAHAAIVVALEADKTDVWMCDGAIAAHNMLLAAEDLGLGGCWCQIYSREGSDRLVRDIARVPQQLTILCVLSLGYKDELRKDYDIDKLSYDKIHWT